MSADRLIPYRGEHLGSRPHIAFLFGQEQIGDFVLATPLMRGFRERYPEVQVDYLGGEGTRQLEESSRLVDARYSLYGPADGLQLLPRFLDQRRAEVGAYDLVVNLDFDPVSARAATLTEARYAAGGALNSGACRVARFGKSRRALRGRRRSE